MNPPTRATRNLLSSLCSLSLLVAVATATAGCGVNLTSYSPRLVTTASADDVGLFARAVRAVRSRGYEIASTSPVEGSFVVPIHSRSRPSDSGTFTVQCYSNGFVEVVPSGIRVRPVVGGGYDMTREILIEYIALVEAVRSASGGAQ